jgi:hypothetical protein
MILKWLQPNVSFYRVDFNKVLKSGMPGRILLTECRDSLLFESPKDRVPKEISHIPEITETIEETVGSELENPSKKKIKAIYFEGARTNNHGILAPTDEFLTDLMIAYMRHRVPIYTVRIHYSKSANYHAASSTASGLSHILFSMLNLTNSAHVKIAALPESATTLRSSLLPAIEQSFTADGSAYLAKRLTAKEYGDFLDYLKATSVDDYAKNK